MCVSSLLCLSIAISNEIKKNSHQHTTDGTPKSTRRNKCASECVCVCARAIVSFMHAFRVHIFLLTLQRIRSTWECATEPFELNTSIKVFVLIPTTFRICIRMFFLSFIRMFAHSLLGRTAQAFAAYSIASPCYVRADFFCLFWFLVNCKVLYVCVRAGFLSV